VEKLRGKDDVGHRRERMRKLDGKIKEVRRPPFLCTLLCPSQAPSSYYKKKGHRLK
jgi:hypothetical protein